MDYIGLREPRFRPPRFKLERARHSPLTETEFLQAGILIYTWLFSGEHFWFYPTRIDGQIVSGFREMYEQWVFVSLYMYEVEGFY